jgi:hypothetical protein
MFVRSSLRAKRGNPESNLEQSTGLPHFARNDSFVNDLAFLADNQFRHAMH